FLRRCSAHRYGQRLMRINSDQTIINRTMGERTIFRREMKLMGNRFEISAVAAEEEWAVERIDAAVDEIRRIERLLTTYDEASETNRINRHAGIESVEGSRGK